MTNKSHDQHATVLFKQNFASTASVVINQGGSNSGKTYAIMQVLFCLASETEKQVITVAGQDIPNLKVGALRDALTIYNGSKQLRSMVRNYNKTDRIFDFYNGSAKHPGPNHKPGQFVGFLSLQRAITITIYILKSFPFRGRKGL
jgi:hypothetical protein